MATYEFTADSVMEINANSSVHPIHGETHDVRGRVSGDVRDGQIVLDTQPTGYFEIPVDALKSGHKLQDMEMRRRIEAKKYPTIRYDLVEVAGGPERFDVTGNLTFHGVTKRFTAPVTARVNGNSLYAEGETTIDVRDYEMKPPKILNLQVYPEVNVKIRLAGKEV